MTKNEKARELIATSETTVKVDPQNGWYLKRFAALQFESSVDNFGTNMPIHVLEQQLPKEDTVKLDDAVIEGQDIDYSKFYDERVMNIRQLVNLCRHCSVLTMTIPFRNTTRKILTCRTSHMKSCGTWTRRMFRKCCRPPLTKPTMWMHTRK